MTRRQRPSLRRLLARLGSGLLMLFSGVITAFIFANSYEIAFNQDIPVAQAIARVDIRPVTPLIPADALATDQARRYGNYGLPTTLRLAASHAKLPIAPAIQNNGVWEARSNTAHAIPLRDAKAGNLGDLLLYARQGWRTIDDPSSLAVDGNLFVDTDKGWRYMYRITAVSHLRATDRYLLPESPKTQLVVVLADDRSDTLTIARAEFLTIQSIEQ